MLEALARHWQPPPRIHRLAVGISWVLGSYAMVGGIILIALGVKLRSTRAVMA